MTPAPVSSETILPVTGIRAGDVPAAMVVVGDPDRAERASRLLANGRVLGRNREYHSSAGTYRGTAVGVISHGVGGPGAAACFEELCRAGVTRMVRAGTAGGMQAHVTDGDLVVATGAVRNDGHSSGIVPLQYPAMADRHLTASLLSRAPGAHEGIVLTSAVFYPHDVIGSDLQLWHRAGVVAVEMEVAALFVVASLHGVAAGAILAIDGNPLADNDTDMSGYDPHRPVVGDAVDRAVTAALDSLVPDVEDDLPRSNQAHGPDRR
ncbi:uridine phosphorylase [soil metagenome]